jgi:DNA-directed RNA polymerase subunit M/transcription elongation factor TFIIS
MSDAVTTEVLAIRARLRELISSNRIRAETTQVLRDLDCLAGLAITKEVLSATRIAASVSQLRTKAENAAITTRASDLFSQWSALLKSGSGKPQQKATEESEDRRKRIREFFHRELEKAARDLPNCVRSAADLAVELEAGLHARADADIVFRALALALTEPEKQSELQFARKLLRGQLSPPEFVALDGAKLVTARQQRELAEARAATLRDAHMPQLSVPECSFFACPKCGSKKVTYYQFQMLASDEPITNICMCVACGQEWME